MRYDRWLVTVLVAAAAALALTPPAGAVDAPGWTPTDAEVSREIRGLLTRSPTIDASGVEAVSKGGVVTLIGTVSNSFERHQVARIVADVVGVTRVVNRLTVEGQERSDDDLRGDVEWLLQNDPGTSGLNVDVTVQDGTLTLTGTVPSRQDADLARIVASDVAGVRSVENNLTIDGDAAEPRSPEEIRREIERRLVASDAVDASNLAVDVADRTVTLTGVVGSAAERLRAESLAWVRGVDQVEMQNVTVSPAVERVRTVDVLNEDALIESLQLALLYEPRVNAFDVDITVRDGVAVLSGTVDNIMARQAAERVARNTRGVYAVENRIVVEGDEILDNELVAASIRRRVALDPVLTGETISVSVDGSTAVLAGQVDNQFERERAALIAARQRGITHIENRLTLSEQTLRPDGQIRDDVRAELVWSPYVDASDIQVTVEDGVVTLTGDVAGWREHRAAIENAYEGGARRVVSNLLVAGTTPERIPYEDATYETFLSPRWLEY